MGKALVVPPAGGFLQATKAGEDAIAALVLAALGKSRSVVDLFSEECRCRLPESDRVKDTFGDLKCRSRPSLIPDDAVFALGVRLVNVLTVRVHTEGRWFRRNRLQWTSDVRS